MPISKETEMLVAKLKDLFLKINESLSEAGSVGIRVDIEVDDASNSRSSARTLYLRERISITL